MRRVVVTGMGLLTSIGNDCDSTWKNLIGCKSGIKKINQFSTEGLTCEIAGYVSHDKNDEFFYDNSIPKYC